MKHKRCPDFVALTAAAGLVAVTTSPHAAFAEVTAVSNFARELADADAGWAGLGSRARG